jgi:hypothetical protein
MVVPEAQLKSRFPSFSSVFRCDDLLEPAEGLLVRDAELAG